MTPSECSRASGISLMTVYGHLRNGTLSGEKQDNGRWTVDKHEFLNWSAWCWEQGRYLMHSPSWTAGYLKFAEINK